MNKQKAHYRLADVILAVEAQGINAFTKTAQEGFALMGLLPSEAIAIVCGLSHANFYKSMTTTANHQIWQDVYHANTPHGVAYIKVTLFADSRIVIQFKER